MTFEYCSKRRLQNSPYLRLSPVLRACFVAAGLGLALSACSKKDLPTNEFQVLSGTTQTRAEAMASAKRICEAETQKSGMSSMLSIFSRLRPGSAEKDFRNCMEERGFDPNAPEPFPERPADGSATVMPAEH